MGTPSRMIPAHRYVRYEDLTPTQMILLDAAAKSMENAYSPYSHFKVGAALLVKDGEIFPGNNIENCNYTKTLHAEDTAISGAYTHGKREIVSLAIIARHENFDTPKPTSPCLGCKQTLVESEEVSGNEIEFILSNTKKDKILVVKGCKNLPDDFIPSELGIDVSVYRTPLRQ